MFLRFLSIRSLLLVVLLVVGLGVLFYLALIRIESAAIQVLLNRQQVIVRAGANNVASFFQVFGESIAGISQLSSIERRDAITIHDLDVFVEEWFDTSLVEGIVLTDKSGVVQLHSSVSGANDVGISLADRDYFLWAKNNSQEGKYFIGQPVISRLEKTKGQIVIPVAAAVYQKGVFVGVLSAPVQLQSLIERFFKLMKISDSFTEIYLIDQHEKLLFSSVPDAVGLNVSEFLRDNIKSPIDTIQEGGLRAAYLDSKSGKQEDHLIAYSSILLGSQNWLLIISSVNQSVVDLAVPIQIRQAAMLILVLLTILLSGIIITRKDKSSTGSVLDKAQKSL